MKNRREVRLWIHDKDAPHGGRIVTALAYPAFWWDGFEFVVHRTVWEPGVKPVAVAADAWTVTAPVTGMNVGRYGRTRREAIDAAIARLMQYDAAHIRDRIEKQTWLARTER